MEANTVTNRALSQLPGISALDIQNLQELGISTTQQLLRQAHTPVQQRTLAAKLQLHEHHIQKWVALADLARVPSVGDEFCGLLLHAGVTSTLRLAQASPQHLHRQILRLHVATLSRRDLSPAIAQVTQWVAEARQLAQGKGQSTIKGEASGLPAKEPHQG